MDLLVCGCDFSGAMVVSWRYGSARGEKKATQHVIVS